MAKKTTSKRTPRAKPAPDVTETLPPEPSLSREAFAGRMSALASENGTPAAAETPAAAPELDVTNSDPLTALAAGEADIAGDGKPAESTGDGASPRTLKTLAETLGISVEDAYAIELSIDVDGKGAETRTIGELKDSLTASANLEARTLEFDERSTREQNDLLRAKQELSEILGALPQGSVPPELIAKAKERAETHRTAEAERVLEAIPEWSGNDERKALDRAGMQAHLAEYGFEPSFLDGAIDHRLVKYMRDNWRRVESVRKALGNVTEIKPPEKAPSSRRGTRPSGRPTIPDTQGQPLTSGQMRSTFSSLTSQN